MNTEKFWETFWQAFNSGGFKTKELRETWIPCLLEHISNAVRFPVDLLRPKVSQKAGEWVFTQRMHPDKMDNSTYVTTVKDWTNASDVMLSLAWVALEHYEQAGKSTGIDAANGGYFGFSFSGATLEYTGLDSVMTAMSDEDWRLWADYSICLSDVPLTGLGNSLLDLWKFDGKPVYTDPDSWGIHHVFFNRRISWEAVAISLLMLPDKKIDDAINGGRVMWEYFTRCDLNGQAQKAYDKLQIKLKEKEASK